MQLLFIRFKSGARLPDLKAGDFQTGTKPMTTSVALQ